MENTESAETTGMPRSALPDVSYTADCEARIAFEVLANRWDSVVVLTLASSGPMRPAALVARIGGISPKVLNEALRRLESNGLAARRLRTDRGGHGAARPDAGDGRVGEALRRRRHGGTGTVHRPDTLARLTDGPWERPFPAVPGS